MPYFGDPLRTIMADAILRLPDVQALTGQSKPTIYRRVRENDFPRPIALGPRTVGWRASDVQAWIDSRPAAPMHDLGIGRGRSKRASS
jgi:prophage regulatory protein